MKQRAARVGLLVAAVVLSVALGEGIVRLALPPLQIVHVESLAAPGERVVSPVRMRLPSHPDQGQLYVETDSGRRLRPNTIAVVENHSLSERRVEIRTNSLGYRNPEIGPRSGLRLLFLGDSITFGDYLAEEDTFVRVVERMASERGLAWETINAGVGAIGLANEIAILQETGLDLKPDAVVLAFYLNDFQESQGVYVLPLPDWLRWSQLARHGARVGSGLVGPGPAGSAAKDEQKARVEAWHAEFLEGRRFERGDPRSSRAAFDAAVARRFADWGGAFSPHAWSAMQPLLAHLRSLSDEHGFELLIAVFPVRLQVEAEALHDEPQRQLASIAEELRVPVLDLLPVLRRAYRTGSPELFFDHCHHTPFGNALIAEALVDFLSVHLP